MRVGVATGEVSVEDGDYFGGPVVQAARLCGVANGGQVLTTNLVRLLADGTTVHGFASVGELELKGLPDPVAAFELAWSATGEARFPLPARLRGAPDAVYVGRADELGMLDRSWQATVAGRSSLVLVAGEPGIGKTRLASQHALAVSEAGGTVLYGGVDEELAVPYQPWIEALSQYVVHATDAFLAGYTDGTGSDLVRLVPELGRRVPDLLRCHRRTQRPSAICCSRRSRGYSMLRPTIALCWSSSTICIEPAKPTLLLLRHLQRALQDAGQFSRDLS